MVEVVVISYFRNALKTTGLIRQLLFGLTIPQQYVCVSSERLLNPLNVFATSHDGQQVADPKLAFVGYKPVLFGGAQPKVAETNLCLHFNAAPELQIDTAWRGFAADSRSVARMILQRLPVTFNANPDLRLFEGKFGNHRFLHPLHQLSNSVRDGFTRQKPGNVNLPGNLHDMVRIAYAMPRKIALVTVSDGERINLFPTDLHGKINDTYYISSLRIGGNAEQQVSRQRRVVISEIESSFYREAYSLGKNHMRNFMREAEFNLAAFRSDGFGFPLPAGVLRYYELEVLEHADVGIHRIFLYRIANSVDVRHGDTLAHIHQYYAQWRVVLKMKSEFLLRP